ncbi:E3 ubiquitin-protein ligase Fancl [Cotesia typhae]|uniref:E3 ubiquitin-protein ligase Fancl n=1 Tax=Cotesia typhae TaxID=2053667 RepID=UPI003D693D53
MNEYEELLKWYPQLILISENPVTLHGLLNINNNCQIEIKLKVPKYPSLKHATVNFGKKISLMYGTDFSVKVNDLLRSINSIMSFLNQLQKLMETIIKDKHVDTIVDADWFDNYNLEELKSALMIPDVNIYASSGLEIIKLTYKDISIKLKETKSYNNPWIIVSSDLPEQRTLPALETCISTLTEAAETLKTRVDSLENIWIDLRDIDNKCWVIDPVKPKPSHLYRRIYINPSLSLLITPDPSSSERLQEIKVLGSDNEVSKCQNTITENLKKWSGERSIIENLLDLLDIEELPRPPDENRLVQPNDGIVDDQECCICFSMESDSGETPSEVCNNEKCQRYFHSSCLLQWLQVIAGNQIFFNRIHGFCPNCNTNISCAIVSN